MSYEAAIEAGADALYENQHVSGMEDSSRGVLVEQATTVIDAALAHPDALIALLVERGALERIGRRDEWRRGDG